MPSHFDSRRRGIAYLGPLLFVAALVVAVWLLYEPVLGAAGRFLNQGVAPRPADAAVVLAGGWTGERILRAGELARKGLAPVVLVSGPAGYYGRPECEYSIPFAVRNGYPESLFTCVHTPGTSTREEAAEMVAELRRRGARRYLLVTSDYHVRRAAGEYRRHGPGLELIPIGVKSPGFDLNRWWTTRDGRKNVVIEWMKVLTYPLGI